MSEVLFREIDIETSKKDDGEVIEIGWTDVTFTPETKEVYISAPRSMLFRPERGMDPGAQGVHHISLAELAEAPLCGPNHIRQIASDGDPFALVAHNAQYERQFFTPDLIGERRFICTFKAALRAWEEAPGHNLQTLRYWRGLELDPAYAMPPHRAGPDSYVGAHILAELLKTERVRDLVNWTIMPRHYRVCPLGKHRGQEWSAIPHDYLKWVTISATDMEPDIKAAAAAELDRRAALG